MSPWRQFPLFRLFIPFAFGIVAGRGCFLNFPLLLFLSFLVYLPLPFACYYSKKLLPYRFRWIPGAIIFPFLFLMGNGLVMRDLRSTRDEQLLTTDMEMRVFIGSVAVPVSEKVSTMKAVLDVFAFRRNGCWYETEARCLVYIRKDEDSKQLVYGNRILVSASVICPQEPGNPQAFDYKRFLGNKGIYYSAFIDRGRWRKLPGSDENPLFAAALFVRDRLLGIFRNGRMQGREFAVAAALTLGYTDEIDNETLKDYSATGAMHILSVSGMHVGIIFLVLDKLLAFLGKKQKGLLIKSSVIILFIWFYALITGLSPAVLRAAVMLSLIMTGKSIKRHPELLNILLASAMGLLIHDPKLITDTGFQLSYLAVAGIIFLYKPIYGLYISGNWLIDKIWALISVSVSAQLGTLPVSLWYFHQFPNFFILTNLLVVPLSSLIIYSAMILLLTSFIPGVTVVLGKVVILLIRCLNEVIHFIGTSPGAVTKGIYISITGIFLLYLLIIFVFLVFARKEKVWLFLLLLVLAGYGAERLYRRATTFNHPVFIVYQARKGGLYSFFNRNESVLAGDLRAARDPVLSDLLDKSRSASGVSEKFRILFLPGKTMSRFSFGRWFFMRPGYFYFNGKKIGIIHTALSEKPFPKINLDYLVISGNPRLKMEEVAAHYTGCKVVIDATNSWTKEQKWMNDARMLGIPCYSVRQSGAFIAEF